MSDKISELVQKLTEDVKNSIDKINALKPKKWSLKSFISVLPEITSLIKELIIGVEKIAKEVDGITGGDKKAAVVEILNGMIDAGTIKIPFVPKWLVKKLLALVVEWIVSTYNEKFGKGTASDEDKDWIDEPNFAVLSVR